ncbi:MAG: hypothetical protein E6Q33_06525 [Neisseriales bacterium]|nr:MAG: hypothetical protein E6Q33_06525 [Neisseriales bacterium]
MKTNDNRNKRFYWLKLKDNFFEREEIQLIESLPNGKEYVLILLKFMMRAINSEGRLVVKDVIPYNPQMLATVTHSNVDTVRSAIDIFIKFGLMSTLDDGILYMNEVQALLGSETEFAAKKREYRQNLKNQPEQLPNKSTKTKKDIVQDKVRQENRDKSLDIRNNITPYIPQTNNSNNDSGIIGVWLEHLKNHNYNFTDSEISAISEFAKYKSETSESVTSQQINLTLERLIEHKNSGYDICRMIKHSIASGYKAVMTPTKDFLVSGVAKPIISGKHPATEYITPESNTQKRELANYLENCYLRKLNPKTKAPLNAGELACLALHKKSQSRSSPYIGWFDYIYRYEVLTGICLLDQPLDSAVTTTKPVAA